MKHKSLFFTCEAHSSQRLQDTVLHCNLQHKATKQLPSKGLIQHHINGSIIPKLLLEPFDHTQHLHTNLYQIPAPNQSIWFFTNPSNVNFHFRTKKIVGLPEAAIYLSMVWLLTFASLGPIVMGFTIYCTCDLYIDENYIVCSHA